MFAFLLVEVVTGSLLAALAGSLIFNFSGFHWHYLPHLQMFNLWALPAGCYFFLRWRAERKLAFWSLLLAVMTYQLAESAFLFYVLVVSVTVLWLGQPFKLKIKEVVLLGIFLPIWVWLVYPYFKLTQEFDEAKRSLRDSAHNSLSVDETLGKYQAGMFGLVTLIALIIQKFRLSSSWLAIALTGLVLALGPVVKLSGTTLKLGSLPLPLPYALAYYLIPGFTGFRTPSRWIVLAALGVAILIGLGLAKIKPWWLKMSAAIGLSVLVLFPSKPAVAQTIDPHPPEVYAQVRALPKEAVILELPIKLWNMPDNQVESQRSLYSLYHQRRRLNGYSGFAPHAWIDLVNRLNNYGLTSSLARELRGLGVTHVVEAGELSRIESYKQTTSNQTIPKN
jgi:hypothetical protein